MEADKEITSLYENYLDYLENKNNSEDFQKLFEQKKNDNSIWIGILKLFIKYEKTFSKNYIITILKHSLTKDTLCTDNFYSYLLVYFLTYFTEVISNQEELISSWRENRTSLIDIILSCFIIYKADKKDNYPQLMNNIEILNKYLNEY